MVSSRSAIAALGLRLCSSLALGTSACLGPNPLLALEGDESETGGSEGDPNETDGDPGDDGDLPGDDLPGADETCTNGVQDGDETGRDCGGSCIPCDDGADCGGADDCGSGVCHEGSCAAPSCEDDVLNGDELEVDCGGSCRFCQHSAYVTELDDYEGSDTITPGVAMYEDGSFALLYPSLQTSEFRVRWFDELAEPLGPGVPLTGDISGPVVASNTLVAGELASRRVYAVLNGLDAQSSNRDAFVIERGPETPAQHWPIYQGTAEVKFADMILDGEVSTFAWEQTDRIYLRRRDLGLPDNAFIDITAKPADPNFIDYVGSEPALARRDGVTVVAWVRCLSLMTDDCSLALRRFDGNWLDPQPVSIPIPHNALAAPQVAIGEDGRVAVTVTVKEPVREIWATILDAELTLEGEPWLLQSNLNANFQVSADVVALADGSFAMAWPDGNDQRVHIRRFLAADTPLVTNVGDEAPWPATENPFWVRLATAGKLVVVVWSGHLDGVYQIQGQVLSY